MGSNPTVSARKRRYVEVYRHSAAFYSPDADSIFLALPPAFGKFCGQGQGFFHCGGAQLFRLGIQMGVDVRRGGDVAVPQPFLDLLHGYPLFQQQAGAGVPQIVKAYFPQAVLLQQLGEVVSDDIGQDKVSHLIHEQVALEFLIVAVAAEFLVVLLLFLQRPQPLGKALYQWKGSQAGFGLGPVRLDKQVLSLHAGSGHRVADGEGSRREVNGVPPQAQHLTPPQPVEGRELDDKFQPVPTGGFKQLLHLLGGVVGGHVPFWFGPLHLVHRVAGDEVQLHRLFQRLVEIGVEPQHTGGFQRFPLVEIKALDVSRLQAAQRDAGGLEIGHDVVLHVEAVGRPSGGLYRGADDLQPVEHVIAEQHIRAQIALAAGHRRRESPAGLP